MDKLQEFLKNYNLDKNIKGNLFIHNFSSNPTISKEEQFKSYFDKGLKKPDACISVLSTMALLNKKQDFAKSIHNYVIKGDCKVILNIPFELNDVFFGDCKKSYGAAGNQDSYNTLIDFLDLKYIPKEFIVGILYDDNYDENTNSFKNSKFIENPHYYNHPIYGKENSKCLIENIKQAVDKRHDKMISMLMNIEPFDEKIFDYNCQFYDAVGMTETTQFIRDTKQQKENWDFSKNLKLDVYDLSKNPLEIDIEDFSL